MEENATNADITATICCCYADYPFAKKLFRFLQRYRFPRYLQHLCPEWPRLSQHIFLPPAERAFGQPGDEIKEVLGKSRYLIVFCTDHSLRDTDGRAYLSACISSFLEQTPLTPVDSIIPVLCRESMETRTKDCLLPELRTMNMLAPDILTKGHRRVFSDVLARLANVEPNILWDRAKHQQRKKRNNRLLAGGAFGALAPILFSVNQWQHETLLYADYTFCDGEPVGVCPVSEQEAARMHRYFRITRSFGHIQKMEQCDYSGCIQDDDDCLYGYPRPAMIEVAHAEDNLLVFRNAKGEKLRTLAFRGTENVHLYGRDIHTPTAFPELMTDFFGYTEFLRNDKRILLQQQKDEKGYMTAVQFRYADGSEFDGGEHNNGITLVRNPAADYRIAELRSAREVVQPRPEKEGESVFDLVLLRLKQLQAKRRFRRLGESAPESNASESRSADTTLTCSYQYRLTVNHRLLSERTLHHEHVLTNGLEYRTQFLWNRDLNLIMEMGYDAQSLCVRRTVYEYDENGRRLCARHFSANGDPILHDGWHEKRYLYNTDIGNESGYEFYDIHGKLIHTERKELSHES